MAGPVVVQLKDITIEDSLESPSAELRYLVTGTEDPVAVYSLIQTGADQNGNPVLSPTYFGFFLTRYRITHVGAGYWDVNVTYSGTLPQTDGSITYQMDFTGGTERRRQSLSTTVYNLIGTDETPTNGGAINFHDGQVEGVDIIVPQFQISVTKYIAIDNLIPDQLQACYDLCGTVNQDKFVLDLNDGQTLTANPGEALFQGAVVNQKGLESWCFTWKFSFAKSRTYVINGIEVTKVGWDYLWVRYAPATSANNIVPAPQFAYVEKVYPDGDFDGLGIGHTEPDLGLGDPEDVP